MRNNYSCLDSTILVQLFLPLHTCDDKASSYFKTMCEFKFCTSGKTQVPLHKTPNVTRDNLKFRKHFIVKESLGSFHFIHLMFCVWAPLADANVLSHSLLGLDNGPLSHNQERMPWHVFSTYLRRWPF